MRRKARSVMGLVQGASALVVLALSQGCADAGAASDAPTPDAGGAVLGDEDAWAVPPLEVEDTGPLSDAGASTDGPARRGEGADPDVNGNAPSCFDGVDDDGNMATDCEDSGCETRRVCCVGSAADACCAPPSTTEFVFATCLGEPTSCATLDAAGLRPRVLSGAPLFSIDHGLVPVSSAGVDAIVDFPALTLSPRGERIVLHATISAPSSMPAPSEQLDATAAGLWAPQSSAATVSPLAAVVVSATRGDVSLVVGDRVVGRADLAADVRDYTLAVAPTGDVTLRVGRITLRAVVALPPGHVVPVVFGRVTNDAPESGTTRLSALRVERGACDLPAALVREGALTPPGETSFEVLHASDPSVLAREGQDDLVAFAAPSAMSAASAIYRARRGADGRLEAPELVVSVQSLADLAEPVTALDLGGPHLFVDGSGAVSMYFAFQDTSGDWRLARLDDIDSASSLTVLTAAGASFDDPAPLGADRLLAREHTGSGGTRLVVLNLSGPGAARASSLCASESDCDGRERLDDYVHTTSADPLAFDHDEVRAPVALEHGGVTRIYFAGRRGTRWSIGMLLEGDAGSFFRMANGGAAVLGPAGSGDDALGTAGPSPLVRDGELELVYAGTDGAHWQLLSARMPIR